MSGLDLDDKKTDEYYAKRFGWSQDKDGFWIHPDERDRWVSPPDFTESIEVMITEIRRRKLGLALMIDDGDSKRGWLVVVGSDNKSKQVESENGAVALAEALDAYLGDL